MKRIGLFILMISLLAAGGAGAYSRDGKRQRSVKRSKAIERKKVEKAEIVESGRSLNAQISLTKKKHIKESELEALTLDKRNYKNLNLKRCIKLALTQNKRLKAAGYGIEAARMRIVETKAILMPVLDYKYQLAPVPQDVDNAFSNFFKGKLVALNRIYIGLVTPITTFGQLKTARKLAKSGWKVAVAQRAKTEAEVIYQTKQLYYGIQLASEYKKLLGEAVTQLGKELRDEQSKDMPSYSPFSLTKLKLFRNELKKRLFEVDEKIELAYQGLRVQMGLHPEVKISLNVLYIKPELKKLAVFKKYLDMSVHKQPDRKKLDAALEASQLKYKLEKLKLLPKAGFAFFVEVGRTSSEVTGIQATDAYQNPFNFTRAGVGLQVSGKLDFHGSYARIKRARAEHFKAVLEGSIAKQGLDLRLKQAYLGAQRAKKIVALSRKNQSMANQMVFMSKSNLEIGVGDNSDYVESLKELLMSRGEYFQAIFDYNMSLATLEQEIGRDGFGHLTNDVEAEEYEFFNGEDLFFEDDIGEGYKNDGFSIEG